MSLDDFDFSMGRGRPSKARIEIDETGFDPRTEMLLSKTVENLTISEKEYLDSIIHGRREAVKGSWTQSRRQESHENARSSEVIEEGIEYELMEGEELCYVDSLQHTHRDEFGDEKLSHMTSKCVRSLIRFGNALGIPRTRLKVSKTGMVFYALKRVERRRAIESGAIPCDRTTYREMFIIPSEKRLANVGQKHPEVKLIPSLNDLCPVCLYPFESHKVAKGLADCRVTCEFEIVRGEVD